MAVRFGMAVTIDDADCCRYDGDTQLLLKGRAELCHHRECNMLNRVRD